MSNEKATFGAGCFWGVEEHFSKLHGVLETAVGYAGGSKAEPTYEDVCRGNTGHAESVEISYDPAQISYRELLEEFFAIHNPTQPYLEAGSSRRSQYRSVIFTHDAEQEREAREMIADLNASGKYSQPIRTEVEPAGTFWRAEEKHQRYIAKRAQPATTV